MFEEALLKREISKITSASEFEDEEIPKFESQDDGFHIGSDEIRVNEVDFIPTRSIYFQVNATYFEKKLGHTFNITNKKSFKEIQNELEKAFIDSIEETPIEDGLYHQSEKIFSHYFDNYEKDFLNWMYECINKKENHELSEGLLRCIGRTNISKQFEMAKEIIEIALQSEKLSIRDSAVRAIENWGEKSTIKLLDKHIEKVNWLADYINEVKKDLQTK